MDPHSMAPPHAQPSDQHGTGGGVREQAQATAEQAKSSAAEVAGTAQEQVREVASEAGRQAQNVASDMRDLLGQEAEQQKTRAADMLAKWADDLSDMAGDGDSPARAVVQQLSVKGREFADQLREGGPNDVLDQVRDFARRRPGAFLLGSAAAGFLVGRIGKGLAGAAQSQSQQQTPSQRPSHSTEDMMTRPTAVQPAPVQPAAVPPPPPVHATNPAYAPVPGQPMPGAPMPGAPMPGGPMPVDPRQGPVR